MLVFELFFANVNVCMEYLDPPKQIFPKFSTFEIIYSLQIAKNLLFSQVMII